MTVSTQAKATTPKHSAFFYGWVIAGLALLCAVVIYGLRYSFSVFYVAILNEFGWSRASTSIIFSVHMLIYGIAAPIAGIMVDRFGAKKVLAIGLLLLAVGFGASSLGQSAWHFYLLYGTIMAFGASIAGFTSLSTLLAGWFVKRRGTAYGIYGMGFGLCFLIPTLAEFLIITVGWRWAFAILGAIPAVIVVPLVILFMKSRPQDMGLLPDGATSADDPTPAARADAEALIVDKQWAATEWTLLSALKTWRLWLLFGAEFLVWGIGYSMMGNHQVAFFVDVGYSGMFAASLVGLFGISYATGNVFGLISDRLGREVTYTLGTLIALFALGMLLIQSYSNNPALPYMYAVGYGIGGGLITPSITAAAADLFHGRNFGAIFGFMTAGFGVGGFIGAWLGGYIHDVTGRYFWAFAIVMVAYAGSCLLMWLAAPRKVRLVAGRAPKA